MAPTAVGPGQPTGGAARQAAPQASGRDEEAEKVGAEWGPKFATPGAELRLEELDRKKVKGWTEVTYRLRTGGFPAGKQYTVWALPSVWATAFRLTTGFVANDSGSLVCGAKPADYKGPPDWCPAPTESVEKKLRLDADRYYKGEAIGFAVISTDGTVRAFARAIPFPIQASDGQCRLAVELLSAQGLAFRVDGQGFAPGETVQTDSRSEGQVLKGQNQADGSGEFHAYQVFSKVAGKESGSASYTAIGASCRVTVKYDWGKRALKEQ